MKSNNIKIIIGFFIIGIIFISFAILINKSSDISSIQNQQVPKTLTANVVNVSGSDENSNEETKYQTVSGIKFETGASGGGLSGIVNNLFTWGIRVAIALSVVFVVIGAVQYMTTDAIGKKQEGKERITAAIGGLLLALISWLILYTINPQIISAPGFFQ